MIAILILALLPFAQTHQSDTLPPLDKRETKKLLRESEKQMARYHLSGGGVRSSTAMPNRHPRDPWNHGDRARIGKLQPSFIEHRGSPLVGRTCQFRCRFELTTMDTDAISKEEDASEFVPTDPLRGEHDQQSDQWVLHTTINATLQRVYAYEKVYPNAAPPPRYKPPKSTPAKDPRQAKRQQEANKAARDKADTERASHAAAISDHKEMVRSLRHELRISLPAGYRPPMEMPRYFDAHARIFSVEWDTRAAFPVLRIHANLVQSEDLNLDASGVMSQP